MINNPILRGFTPDPSIMRNGDDYYIATSTFEWWPGVRIFHSKNLGSDISLYIKVEEGARIRFGYGNRGSCTFIDKVFSTSVLCDEYCRGFTGSQFGTSLITRVEYISAEEYNNRYHNKIFVSYLCV